MRTRLGGRFLALFAASNLSAQTTAVPADVWVDRVMSVRSVIGGDPAQWSPDGSRLLFASSLGGASALWSVPAAGGFPTRVVEDIGNVPFQLSQRPGWSPTGEWISYLSARGNENGQPDLWVWSTKDGRHRRLTRLASRVGWSSWSPDGKSIALSAGADGNYDIWKVSVADGRATRLTADPNYDVTPEWTPDGAHIVFVRTDDRWVDHEIVAITADGRSPRTIVRVNDFFDYQTSGNPHFGAPRVSPDGKTLLYRSWQSGWINYWTVPVAGGQPTRLAPAPHDQSEARWSPDGTRIAYVENHNGTHDLRVVAAAGGVPRALVKPSMGVVSGAEWSPSGSRISYSLATPTTAPDLHTVDPATGTSTQLTFSAPGGNVDAQLVSPTKVSYRSDTLTIPAYLYTPKAVRPGQKLPAIIFAHGGPTSQYNDTYEQQMQFFAGQGYVVLAPNFRGSSGYGRRFADLNNKCWAHCDLADLVAGVTYLKTLGYVDTDRVAVTGTSHGGLLSMAAATFAKGVFKATVPHGGTADRIYYYNTQELRHIKQADNEFGPLKGNEGVYRYVSPFYWVSQVDTPQFVIWGEGEWPSSLNSRLYVAELERQYKPHKWKAYQGENYYVSGRANVRRMLLDMLDYLNSYLKDTP